MTNAYPRLFTSIVVSVIVVALVGCAQAEPEALPTPTATPMPSATQTADPFALPVSAFDVTCDELVPLAKMVELYGAGTVRMDARYAGVGEAGMQQAAAVTDGGIICHWGLADSSFPVATITATLATPAQFSIAAAGFDEVLSLPPVPILDDARAYCSDGYPGDTSLAQCGWTTFFDGVWLVAAFYDMPASEIVPPAVRENPDTSSNPPTARLDALSTRIIIDAAERLRDSKLPETSQARVPLATCVQVVDQLRTQLSETVEFGETYDRTVFESADMWSTSADFGWGISSLAIERQGWTECGVELLGDSMGSLIVTIARDAAWVLTNDIPAVAEMQPLAGREGVIRCAFYEDGGGCDAAIAVGVDLVAITVYDNDQQLAEALVVAAASILN